MQVLKFESTEQWLAEREARITGSKANKLYSKKDGKTRLEGFYETAAARFIIKSADGSPMQMGHTNEPIALELFTQKTGIVLNHDKVMWVADNNPYIAVSPDGQGEEVDGKITVAGECKSLSPAKHLRAFVEKKIPDDYDEQIDQYFIVNEHLETLYFIMYQPMLPCAFIYFTIHRGERLESIAAQTAMQNRALEEFKAIETMITF